LKIKKLIERIYGASGKEEELSKLSDEEMLQLAHNLKEGVPFATPVFDGAAEGEINAMLEMAGLRFPGRSRSTTAAPASSSTARSRWATCTCSSSITWSTTRCTRARPGRTAWSRQQPLGARRSSAASASAKWRCGRSKPTARPTRCRRCSAVKSDDITGRTKVYENIVKGDHKIDAGMPESFNVLVKEIRSLGIDIDLERY